MNKLKNKILWFVVATLFFLFIFIYKDIWAFSSGNLEVIFFNVGQGDSILIQTPGSQQILIDGGPDEKILDKIRKEIPFYDNQIEVMIISNPDKDHIGGLIPILENYQIKTIVLPGTFNSSNIFSLLKKRILEEKSTLILGRRGLVFEIYFGKNKAFLEVLYPDHDVSYETTNKGSLVAKLTYNDKSFLFMGDADISVENNLLFSLKEKLKSNVLKVGHHGSQTSSSFDFIKTVEPEYAVISAGLKNRYGHPHQEVIDNLLRKNVKILKTFEEEDIIFKTNGQNLSLISQN